jgi:subtilisin family serine protease
MTLKPRGLAVALALLLLSAPSALSSPQRPVFVPGELLVQFHPEVSAAMRERVLATHGLAVLKALRADGILKVRIPDAADPRSLAARLRALGEVAAAEPNYYRYLDTVPNDLRFGEMYGLDNSGQTGGIADADIDAPEAWDLAVGSPDVVVGIVDSGMDMGHEDLAANLYTNPGEIENGLDDDGNGYVDDLHGWDFREDDNNPSDPSALCASHGTHTAGTVGAVGNNGIGVTGVAQNVRLMPLRAFYVASFILCTAQDSDLLEAIAYMRIMQVPISNNSWGGGPSSTLMKNAIAATRQLFVTSAGNNGTNNDGAPSFPASYDLDNIIAVAASNSSDSLAGFSNFGVKSVDLAAPGAGILSTTRGDTYGVLDGTSMASPHVAGAAAVLLGDDPTLTPQEIRARLLRGTDPKGFPVATGGRLNLFGALTLPPSTVVIDVIPQSSTAISPGDTVTYVRRIENTSASARVVTVSVRAWTPGGSVVTVQAPRSINLAAGEVRSGTFRVVVPATAPPGSYRLIGRVENPTDAFDEDQEIYEMN